MASWQHSFAILIAFLSLLVGVSWAAYPQLGKSCRSDTQEHDCSAQLVCLKGSCEFCQVDAQCKETFSKYVCDIQDNHENTCQHKGLFPMDSGDVWTSFCAIVLGALAAGGGIGGGGALVPILVLVDGFTPAGAVPLSKAFILGASLVNLHHFYPKRHPTADRPLIDYKTAALFVPTQLLGTQIGVMCNRIWPGWLITVCLIVFLSFITKKTYKKAMDLHAVESRASDVQSETQRLIVKEDGVARRPRVYTPDLARPSPSAPKGSESSDATSSHTPGSTAANSEGLQAILKREAQVPWEDMKVLAGVWVLVVFVSLLRGGEGSGSVVGVRCGTFVYWMLYLLPFPIVGAVVLVMGNKLKQLHTKKDLLGYTYHDGDVVWTADSIVNYPAMCTLAGFGSGALGIGGGTVTSPLMLHLNMNAQVVAATASFMILFTSSSTTFQFMIMGVLMPSYAIWFMLMGSCSAALGQYVISWLLKKYRKQSIIVFCITAILGISAVALGLDGFVQFISDIIAGRRLWFRSICHVRDK